MTDKDRTTQNEGAPAKRSKKTKSSSISGYIMFLIALLALGGAGYYAINQISEPEPVDEEYAAFEMLSSSEDLADFEDFMTRFPDSPRMRDVKERHEELQKMYSQWNNACYADNVRDYSMFLKNYPNSSLKTVCNNKIDSLDWEAAKAKGGHDDIEAYLKKHPNGLYITQATAMQSKIIDTTATIEEKLLVEETLRGFFQAYGDNNIDAIYMIVAPTMKRFLSKENATKADVADIIERTYNEHIQSCKFVLNGDYRVTKEGVEGEEPNYKVSFSVDQHIERDNSGKTFGSYIAEAIVTSQYKLLSLRMNEICRKEGPKELEKTIEKNPDKKPERRHSSSSADRHADL